MAEFDSPQEEKLRRVVGDPDELLAVWNGMAKPADSDHRIGGDEQNGSKASQRVPRSATCRLETQPLPAAECTEP
jgi:hypothetical protein